MGTDLTGSPICMSVYIKKCTRGREGITISSHRGSNQEQELKKEVGRTSLSGPDPISQHALPEVWFKLPPA